MKRRSATVVVAAAAVIAGAALLAGCSPTGAVDDATAVDRPPVSSFPTGVVVDYQLGGGYAPAAGVGGVARDSTDVPAPGLYSICYLNGFQTQPADRQLWLDDRAELVLTADGEPVIDENWPDELILDTSTAEKRAAIAGIMATEIENCAGSGFDAVEFDNLDTYTRSDGAFSDDDNLELAKLYTHTAHAAGLAVGQKNSSDLGSRGRDEAGFDFAVAEECHRFDECSAYTAVYGDAVIDIEYGDDLRGSFAEVCADPQVPASTILRDRDLTTPADADYVFDNC